MSGFVPNAHVLLLRCAVLVRDEGISCFSETSSRCSSITESSEEGEVGKRLDGEGTE